MNKCNATIIAVIIFIIIYLINIGFEMLSGYITAHSLGYKCKYNIFAGTILVKPNGEKILLKQLRYYE